MDWTTTLKSVAMDGDSLVISVEALVTMPKRAVEIAPRTTRTGRQRRHVPNKLVLTVKAVGGRARPLTVTASKAGGQWFMRLVTDTGDILRAYDYQFGGHPNPDGSITGRSHKHFPTHFCPLREDLKVVKKWAYDPEPFPVDFGAAVKLFCRECNIDIDGIQERMNWGDSDEMV